MQNNNKQQRVQKIKITPNSFVITFQSFTLEYNAFEIISVTIPSLPTLLFCQIFYRGFGR